MIKIDLKIKPMSINKAFQGRRFKTKEYIKYSEVVTMMLPKLKFPAPPFKFYIEYGFSNVASDIDNPTKLIIDIMQKKYDFNDKNIFEMKLKKVKVAKGEEYIKIFVEEYTNE